MEHLLPGLSNWTLTHDMGISYDSLYHPKYLRSYTTDVTTGKPKNCNSEDFNGEISEKSSNMQRSTCEMEGNLSERSNNPPSGESENIPSEELEDNSPDAFSDFLGGERVEDPRFLIDKCVVYTDYQPRLEGSCRYFGANRPETCIMTYPFYDDSRRAVYRDRRYILEGFSYPAEFYSPDYSQQTPPEPTDYRRTLYWNPNLQLDENGEANITFYNNSRHTSLSIETEGQASDGNLLWGKW